MKGVPGEPNRLQYGRSLSDRDLRRHILHDQLVLRLIVEPFIIVFDIEVRASDATTVRFLSIKPIGFRMVPDHISPSLLNEPPQDGVLEFVQGRFLSAPLLRTPMLPSRVRS